MRYRKGFRAEKEVFSGNRVSISPKARKIMPWPRSPNIRPNIKGNVIIVIIPGFIS